MKIALYFHAGSKNHGCEALVRATAKIFDNEDRTCYSIRKEEDLQYGLEECCEIKENWLSRKQWMKWIFLSVLGKLGLVSQDAKRHYYTLHCEEKIALSIGGDNYCYKGQPEQLAYINKRLKAQGKRTVLWGCSIEPELLKDRNVVEDLKRYDLITVRESITREALEKAGVSRNVRQFPDPAFQLDQVRLPLPDGFIEGNTIGINVSPLIMKYEKNGGMTYKNYKNLVHYILEETGYHIALIPHVIGAGNDDREALQQLMGPYRENKRVVMLGDHNCMELKGYIARCRMFVGARTHATIAAYSTKVPTLVVGYSVKARGIARDLFGTEKHYVLPVQELDGEDRLVKAFQWLEEHEGKILDIYNQKMEEYILSAKQAGEEVRGIR